MSNLTVERFLKDLRDSGVVPEESLQRLLSRRQGEGSTRALALTRCRRRLLTDWQAKFILSGRSRLPRRELSLGGSEPNAMNSGIVLSRGTSPFTGEIQLRRFCLKKLREHRRSLLR
jgi:hypothetical protein